MKGGAYIGKKGELSRYTFRCYFFCYRRIDTRVTLRVMSKLIPPSLH